ncbi:MAG: zinc uptake transcriptional repressor Zur [Acetobacteraceae bacterium]
MSAQPQPAPFGAGIEAQLDRAAGLCARRGARLTDLRRQVLGLILGAGAPIGAYELLDRLRPHRQGAAPPTVYRALEFLLAQGIIHRVERLSAFVSCLDQEAHGLEHEHRAQFLICGGCGQVTEIEDHAVEHALAEAARRSGFSISGATIEAEGRCAACQSA